MKNGVLEETIQELLTEIITVLTALERGVNGLIMATPRLVQQEIDGYIEKTLDTTAEEMMNAVDTYWDEGVLVIEIDDDNWLANALETGVQGWDMKETHLNSPKAKYSKEGFKYLVIPMQKHPSSRGGGTEKSQMYHRMINEALENPSYSAPTVQIAMDGTAGTMERLNTTNTMLHGFYRVQRYRDAEQIKKGTPMSTQFVMFRTMSNHPKQAGKWIHAGIRGINMFGHMEQWSMNEYEFIANRFLEQYVSSALES